MGRGLSDRDIESLVEEAGLGELSKTPVCEITKELRARYQAFRAQGLGDVELLVLFLDAIHLPTRPSRAKKGVLVARGYDAAGQRVLLDVVLGQRERGTCERELPTRAGPAATTPWAVQSYSSPLAPRGG